MARKRTKDFDLTLGQRRINGRIYEQPTTLLERKLKIKGRMIAKLPHGTPLVYFVKSQYGAVKIGRSSSRRALRSRIAVLQSGSHVPIRLLGAVAGAEVDEKRAHASLAEHRQRGEWFRWCDVVCLYIEEALRLGRVPDANCEGIPINENPILHDHTNQPVSS